jgi:hypothetical protein
MNRRARRHKDRARDSGRQTLAVVAVAALLAGGLLAAAPSITARPPAARPAGVAAGAPTTKTAAARTGLGDDDIYTGSILYMPQEGKTCRQFLFDNQTGRFSDNGYVDCVDAAYHGPGEPKLGSAARARVISNAFRHD